MFSSVKEHVLQQSLWGDDHLKTHSGKMCRESERISLFPRKMTLECVLPFEPIYYFKVFWKKGWKIQNDNYVVINVMKKKTLTNINCYFTL